MEIGLDGVMKKFDLQKYLSNPSRKVITRDRRLVRILCTDAKGEYPIVALTIENHLRDMVLICEVDGTDIRSENNDLFFDVETKHGWVNLWRTERGFIVFELFILDFLLDFFDLERLSSLKEWRRETLNESLFFFSRKKHVLL